MSVIDAPPYHGTDDDDRVALTLSPDGKVSRTTPSTASSPFAAASSRTAVPWARLGAILVLVLTCIAYLTISTGADALRVVQVDVRLALNLTETQLGVAFAAYNFPSVVVVLVGGLVIDRFGVRLSCVFFASLCVLGLLTQSVSVLPGVQSYAGIVAGRFIHGFGGEPLFVTWDTFLTLWWPDALPLAMSLYCSAGRVGDILAYLAMPPLVNALNYTATMWLCCAMTALGFVACVTLVVVDKRAATATAEATSHAAEKPARSLRAKLASFPGGYWVAVMIALVQYGILGVMIAFMPEYLLRLYGRDKTDSPMLVAVIFAVALVTTTLHGFILTRFHTWWRMRFGSVLVAAGAMLAANVVLLAGAPAPFCMFAGLAATGLAYGFTSAALWGTIGIYSTEETMGIVYSIPYSGFNLSGLLLSALCGYLFDRVGAWAVGVCWIAGSTTSALFAALWMWLERNRGRDDADATRIKSGSSAARATADVMDEDDF